MICATRVSRLCAGVVCRRGEIDRGHELAFFFFSFLLIEGPDGGGSKDITLAWVAVGGFKIGLGVNSHQD
jgi:hypothetical protein